MNKQRTPNSPPVSMWVGAYKREQSGRHGKRFDILLLETVNMLSEDKPLPQRYFDHPLCDAWNDHRDCHIMHQSIAD